MLYHRTGEGTATPGQGWGQHCSLCSSVQPPSAPSCCTPLPTPTSHLPAREARGDAPRLAQSPTCPRFEPVTLTNIIQRLDILGEQSARFINPANFRSAHAVFWFPGTITCRGSSSCGPPCRSDPRHGAEQGRLPRSAEHAPRLQTWLAAGIFQPSRKPQRSPQPNPFFKMTCFHLLVPGVN